MRYGTAPHTIDLFADTEQGRIAWECDCGARGSSPAYRVEKAAEVHVPGENPIVYRSSERRDDNGR